MAKKLPLRVFVHCKQASLNMLFVIDAQACQHLAGSFLRIFKQIFINDELIEAVFVVEIGHQRQSISYGNISIQCLGICL